MAIADEAYLPPVWHAISQCTKKQEILVFAQETEAFACSAHCFNRVAPVVTPKLYQGLVAFWFSPKFSDDITCGLHPFAISLGNEEQHQAHIDLARQFHLLTSNDHSIMLSDLERFEKKFAHSIPVNYFEMERCLGMFGNLLGTVCGPTHPLTIAYCDFWELLTQSRSAEIQQLIDA
jgi:hypothetical protein